MDFINELNWLNWATQVRLKFALQSTKYQVGSVFLP
jgi:hypothetical protein